MNGGNRKELIDSVKYGSDLVLVDFHKDISELIMSDSDIMELLYTAHMGKVYKNSYLKYWIIVLFLFRMIIVGTWKYISMILNILTTPSMKY